MARVTVITVLYTRNVLAVSLVRTKSSYWLFEPDYRADFDLGYDARTPGEPGEDEYWGAVGSKLEQAMFQNGNRLPDKVLLMGDCISDENFQRVLKKTLRLDQAGTPEVFSNDEEGVAAKGAAEFAKRSPYTY